MGRSSDCQPGYTDNDQAMLLYIQGPVQFHEALQQAVQRIRASIRCSDIVLLLNGACAVVLVGTPFIGAQAVARRLYALLVDIEYELQIISGPAAYVLLQRLQTEGAVIVEEEAGWANDQRGIEVKQQLGEANTLPYLAFLVNYPSHRLLHLFPYELACHYRCIPVGAERDSITIATCQPLKHEAILRFREATQRNIFQIRCEAGTIDDVLHYWRCKVQPRKNIIRK